jgi:hypothetical protein
MRPLRIEEHVQQAWVRGVTRGDGPPLRELARFTSAHPRLRELRCFAAIATMLDEDPPDTIEGLDELTGEADQPACERVLVDVVHALLACQRLDVPGALAALDELSVSLADARATVPPDPRLSRATGWADLAIAECCLVARDLSTAR